MLVGLLLELDELLGLDPPLDRVVALGRAQVLRDGEQIAAGVAQVAHRLADLLAVSPMPRMRLDLVTSPDARACGSTSSERS